MMDLAAKAGLSYDFNKLSKKLEYSVIPVNARQGVGINELKLQLSKTGAAANHTYLPGMERSQPAGKGVAR